MTSVCGAREHEQSLVSEVSHDVTFQHGHAPTHDSIKPTYNMVEFCCDEHSMLSDPVIHASHACSLRITKGVDGSSARVHDPVNNHMSNGLPTPGPYGSLVFDSVHGWLCFHFIERTTRQPC
eukprot:274845-Amphidinium_carterae.1